MWNLIDILYREYCLARLREMRRITLLSLKREQSVAGSICDLCDLPTCGEPKSGVIWSDRDRRRRLCSHRQTIC